MIDRYDVAVIGNLGFVWDGRALIIRVLCPDNRMQPLVSYEQYKATKSRQVARWHRKRRAARRATA